MREGKSGGRILVVDDQERWQRVLGRMLDEGGYRVETAADGEEALRMVRDDPPDLVLLDVHMPGMLGYDVLAELRAEGRFATLPIVILTAQNRLEGLVQGFELGADDYLAKPIQSPELLARVGAILRTRRLQAELQATARRAERELELARSIQQALLPLPLPERPGLDMAAVYLPMQALGGDFFDVIALEEAVTGVFLADVVGHGASAALLTSFLKALVVHDLGGAGPGNGADLFQGMNRSLLDALGARGLFVTALYLEFHPDRGGAVFFNAGHPAPLLLRREGEPELLEGAELPLGVRLRTEYEPRCVGLEEGDRLLLYTDGILEQRHEGSGELYGRERLMELLAATRGLTAAAAAEQMEASIRDWAGDARQDDVNLIVVDRVGEVRPRTPR